MVNINTRNKIVDAATQYFAPILSRCEDFNTFIRYVDKEMDLIKTEVIHNCIVQFDNDLRDELPDGWSIIRKEKRTIICVFGKVKFKRTLFLDEYGRRRYLCDELLGIAPKSRFSADAFIWLMNTITTLSYGKTAKAFEKISGVKISKMAIWHMVQKEAILIENYGHTCTHETITQESICVETDGVFIALQSPKRRKNTIKRFFYEQQHHKKSFEIKCGCVYAGKIQERNRTRRLCVNLVSGNYEASELWSRITNNIKKTYDSEYLNHIFYGSDAGSWCKNHMLDINNDLHATVYQAIDRYHVMQAIWSVFPKGKSQDWLVSLIMRRKPERFIKDLKKMMPMIHVNKRNKANNLMRYISNNIDLIKAGFNLGTMEGTNAHVWARRMKHIGGAWSEHGGHAMAVLLAHVYSGKDPIPPRINAFFTKDDNKKKREALEKLGAIVGHIKSIGQGYEPPRGHIPHNKHKELFIPGLYNSAF